MIKILVNSFAIIAFVYVVYALVFYFLQRSILFPLSKLPPHNASLITNAGGEIIPLEFSQGFFELAYLAPLLDKRTTQDASPVIILAHGNGNIMDDWAGRMDFMRQQGYAVVLVEYPGYGRSQGKPSYASIKETMGLAYQWVEDNPLLDRDNIVLIGRSMGGGAVLSLIPEKNPKAIILMSTYSSVTDLANSRWLPDFLVQDPFDNVKALSQYQGRTYLIHGKGDKTVPFEALGKLLAVAQQTEHKVYSSGHSDTPNDWPQYWQDVLKVISVQ